MRTFGASLALALLGFAGVASAHGRPPALYALHVDRRDPSHLVAQATWGFAVSRDGGASWRWSCAAALGVDPRFEDPRIVLGYEGRILAATYDGVLVSDADGCLWAHDEGIGDRWTIDLRRDPSAPERLFAVTTDVLDRDRLYVSEDEGRSFAPWSEPLDEVLLDALFVAPSRPARVYVSADVPGLPAERQTMVLRSDDGGRSFTRLPFTDLAEDERALRVRAVGALDPEVVFAVALRVVGTELDAHRLLRSEDGGATFETVLRSERLADVLVSPDGETVVTGSATGGVFRSDDAGRTFARVNEGLPVTCLAAVAGELYACTLEVPAGLALARSADGGASWEPIVRLSQIDRMIECPRCSDVGATCPSWQPDVAFDLGLDGGPGVTVDPDGGLGRPRDASRPAECDGAPPPAGCACRTAARVGGAPWGLLLALRLRGRPRRAR
ncbi:MAG: exo-alpha-sialidase [Sandaracinaceae bacterium]|nr:exo-alpha-sialidase [Sandaracinaceae bacterium]